MLASNLLNRKNGNIIHLRTNSTCVLTNQSTNFAKTGEQNHTNRSSTFTFLSSSAGCRMVGYTFFSQIRKYDVLTPLYQMWALRIHRLSIRRCCELPRRSACLALRTSSVETLRHRTCGSKKIERWFAAPVARRTRRCCKLSRRSTCLALRASPVETLRHRTRGSKNIERRLAAPQLRVFGDIVADCPGVSLVWSCVLPQWRPCTTGLVEFEKDREGCSVVSKPC
jgi:hypothetical protein